MSCCQKLIGGAPSGGGSTCPLGLVDYNVAQSDTTFSTNSAVFVSTGKTLVTPVIPAGLYRFGISYLNGATWFGIGNFNVRLDGGAFIFPTTQVQDVDSTSEERHPQYRTRLLNLSNAAHTFVLETRDSSGFGFLINVYQTTFELWLNSPSAAGVKPCPCASSRQTTTNSIVVTGRTFSGRQLVTPALAAGVYRLEVFYSFAKVSGNRCDFNIALDGGADILPSSAREYPTTTDRLPRQFLRNVTLGAGSHTFELTLNRNAGTTTISLGETSFYLHRIS